MTLVKPKAATREAWQYTGQPRSEWPEWVQACCLLAQNMGGSGVEMYLWRRSGSQIMRTSEWLVRNLDGDPEWLTHDQMRKAFDEVVG